MKASVEHLKQEFAFSERRECSLLDVPVSTFRYHSSQCDAELREKLVELARGEAAVWLPAAACAVAPER